MDNTVHLTAVDFTIGEHIAPLAVPPQRMRRRRRPSLASTIKQAKRGGADRVEVDPHTGRFVIPLAGNALGEPAAEPNGGSNELEDWIATHADQAKRP